MALKRPELYTTTPFVYEGPLHDTHDTRQRLVRRSRETETTTTTTKAKGNRSLNCCGGHAHVRYVVPRRGDEEAKVLFSNKDDNEEACVSAELEFQIGTH